MNTPTRTGLVLSVPVWALLAAPLAAQFTVAPVGVTPEPRQGHVGFFDEPRGRVVIVGGDRNPMGTARASDVWQREGTRWIRMASDFGGPTPIAFPAAAADPGRRGDSVLFGGSTPLIPLSAETWVWNSATAQFEFRTNGGPTGRNFHAMAFDPIRNHVVLFAGGDFSGALRDTWVWDGLTWSQPSLGALPPPARRNHAMAFDPRRGEVVLFGGWNGGSFGDTWFFNTNWYQTGGGFTNPPARHNHVMASDPLHSEVVLFGGKDNGGNLLGDTWVLRNIGWVHLNPPVSPAARELASLTWDDRRQRVVLFGGNATLGELTGLVADSWEWDGTTWTPVDPPVPVPSGPSARRGTAAAFDTYRNRAVLYGGASPTILDETWVYADGFWQQRHPSTSPRESRGAAMVYDSGTGACLLFGGATATGYLGDVFAFDGQNWSLRLRANGLNTPAPRAFHGLAMDVPRQKVVLFGGRVGSTLLNDTWELSLTNPPVWTLAAPANRPSARESFAMTYDFGSGVTLLHGGIDASGNTLMDTWAWDGQNWSQIRISGPDRRNHAMTYDFNRGHVVMWGGLNTGGGLPTEFDEWNASLSSWIVVQTTSAPTGMIDPTLLFDPLRGRLTLHGSPGPTLSLPEDHDLVGTTWVRRTPDTSPSPRTFHAAAFDPIRRVTVTAGGQHADATSVHDHWEFDGQTWHQRMPVLLPGPRNGHAMAFDSTSGGGVVLFGGQFPSGSVVADTWRYDSASDTWRELAASGPAPRMNHTLTSVPGGGALLFGGHDAHPTQPTTFSDVWSYANGSWSTYLVLGGFPPARQSHAAAFDPVRNRLVVFGGIGPAAFVFNDTWEFSFSGGSAQWVQASPSISPSGRWNAAMAYDSRRGRIVLSGGYDPVLQVFLDDVWEWDGRAWTERTHETTRAPAVENCTLTYDSARGRLVRFGGNNFGGTLASANEIWSNIDLAGTASPSGTPGNRLRAEAQAIVGRVMPLTFTNPRGIGVLTIDFGPLRAPVMVLGAPLFCGQTNIWSSLAIPPLTVPTNGVGNVNLSIPNLPVLVGGVLVLQGMALGHTGCLAATDAIQAIMQTP